MKRFIDLRGQGASGNQFAFWDTVYDVFESFDGATAWETWAEFEEYFTSDKAYYPYRDPDYKHHQIDRYRALCPAWVFNDYIEDGFGNRWSIICPECEERTMVVQRPGKAECLGGLTGECAAR